MYCCLNRVDYRRQQNLMECQDIEGFSAIARDHAANPRNYGPIGNCNGHSIITGPCGDTMEFWVSVQNNSVKTASFVTDGCAPSLACGSMATVLATDATICDVAQITQQDIIDSLGGLPPDHEHCALLAVNTLLAACQDYLEYKTGASMESRKEHSACDACEEKDCSVLNQRKDETDEEFESRRKLQSRLCRIRHKIVVMSGKGGVGKSTVAVNLASALMLSGKRVGLLDVDIHGPSVPTMLGLEGEQIQGGEDGLIPVEVGGMKVMSIGFLLQDPDEAVIWRGPMKMGVIKQFLQDVDWGDLDYLIIDSPSRNW